MIVACRTTQSFRNRNTCMYLVCPSYWFCWCCCSWKTFCDLQTVALSRFKAGEKQDLPLNDQSLVLGLIAHMRNFIARKESNQTWITAMLGCSHVSLWKFIMWTIDPRSGKLIRFIGSTGANLIISQDFWSCSCFHDVIIHSVHQHFIQRACWCSASSSTHLRQFHHMKSID